MTAPELTAKSAPIPAWERVVWEGNNVANRGGLPLWSGKGEPPAIGSIVITNDRIGHRIMVTGYEVVEGWLMALGYRIDEPTKHGNLAGMEIKW